MKAIDCPCGHRLEGADNDELVRLAREHVDSHHLDMERSDEELRQLVASGVLVPGGRIQIADVTIQKPVSEEGRRNIDLWTG